MSNQFARVTETTIIATSDDSGFGEPSSSVELEKADKYSIQVIATDGNNYVDIEGSNDNITFTYIDEKQTADGESVMFEQPDVAYRYMRLRLYKDQDDPVTATGLLLVIGSPT